MPSDRVPPLVGLDGEVEDEELLVRWLSEKRGQNSQALVPQRGTRRSWCRCAAKCGGKHRPADGQLAGRPLPWMNCAGCWGWKGPCLYRKLRHLQPGRRENVAGMVVFENGRPLKSATGSSRSRQEGQDDYGSMRKSSAAGSRSTVPARRKGGRGFGRLPDLILLDGGRATWRLCSPFWRRWALRCPCSAW